MNSKLAPIALFVYNRPRHTQQALASLAANQLSRESTLYVFADGAKPSASTEEMAKVQATRKIVYQQKWPKQMFVHERKENLGLANNLIHGISQVLETHDRIIVLEDDLVTSPGFLTYMNEALELYASEKSVMQINGYMYPLRRALPETFFYNVISSWGWGTWQSAWQALNTNASELLKALKEQHKLSYFDLQGNGGFLETLEAAQTGNLDVWAVYWYASVCLQNGFCLNPKQSFVQNMGFDGSGTNTGKSQFYWIPALAPKVNVAPIPLVENSSVRRAMRSYYRYGGDTYGHRFLYFWRVFKRYIYKFVPRQIRSFYQNLKRKYLIRI